MRQFLLYSVAILLGVTVTTILLTIFLIMTDSFFEWNPLLILLEFLTGYPGQLGFDILIRLPFNLIDYDCILFYPFCAGLGSLLYFWLIMMIYVVGKFIFSLVGNRNLVYRC